ncbi:PREDICTED: uncharacterized protein LOC109232612 [Nicotiana attenuata]|uniref:uncharacterized protein LOC109232612 n=1 Tax=Nicotiana attenuata TaxID=49451 RepID=UPI0009057A54|nr:PREDICTED: uncharacterized protein LOC109232612 [Nicotiana attenuata]
MEQRRVLWDNLQQLSLSIAVPWMIAGDFNAVLCPNDRLSSNPPGADRVSSRLDRVVGNYKWMTSWGHVETNYGLPQISYHAPMLLTLTSYTSKGRVTFRFFNIWAAHEDFPQIVANMWNSQSTQGTLKSVWTRLKDLKRALKALNSNEFRGITQKIEKSRLELRDIQEKISQDCTDTLLDMEKKTLLNLEKWSLIEESVLQQKARARWIQLGHSNSKYFSLVMKHRTQKKQITEITTLLGDKLTDPDAIKREIVEFYKGLMGSVATSLPAINRVYMKNGPTLSHQQRVDLCAEVTNQEIVESLKEIGDDKAPGNGFNAVFFKKAWDIINTQITDAVKEFFSTEKIYKAINCTTVTLVPKVTKPAIVKEKIADNVILAQSWLNLTLEPRYLLDVIEELGFPDRFIMWIMECIKTVNYTILVNRETTKPSNAAKGLRQGDPISPFLFAVVMEYLSRSLLEHKKDPTFQYHPRWKYENE